MVSVEYKYAGGDLTYICHIICEIEKGQCKTVAIFQKFDARLICANSVSMLIWFKGIYIVVMRLQNANIIILF